VCERYFEDEEKSGTGNDDTQARAHTVFHTQQHELCMVVFDNRNSQNHSSNSAALEWGTIILSGHRNANLVSAGVVKTSQSGARSIRRGQSSWPMRSGT